MRADRRELLGYGLVALLLGITMISVAFVSQIPVKSEEAQDEPVR